MDRVDGYKRSDCDDYIREGLNSRVFVDFEVFLKAVLHVPHDWRTLWGPAIEAVKADEKFIGHHEKYYGLCGKRGTVAMSSYAPLTETANAVIDVLYRNEFGGISGSLQHSHVNDPKRLQGGVMNWANLSPNLVVLHKDCTAPEDSKTKDKKSNNTNNTRTKDPGPEDTNPGDIRPKDARPKDIKPSGGLHWANALHILEVKPYDSAICDGTTIPRLIVDGQHVSSSLRGGP